MSSTRYLALLAAVPAFAAAAGGGAGTGFIRHSITPKLPSSSNNWVKRQSEAPLQDQRTGTLYTINLGIGTPSQEVDVIIDTGSSELWVNPDCSTAGSDSNTAFCESLDQFDTKASSSLKDTGVKGDISYGKGHVDLEYVSDFVSVGSARIEAQVFGAATGSSDIPAGILGLAPPVTGSPPAHPLVLDSLASQGFINSRAFALDLRSIDSPDDGSVIFGGIDTKKYRGSLEKVPILDLSEAQGDRYWISLNSAGVTLPDGSEKSVYDGTGIPVFLDSGGTLSRLPTSIFNGIGGSIPTAKFDSGSGYYIVDCAVAAMEGSVDFGFGQKVIKVDYKDFIWHVPDSSFCVVGVLPDDEDSVLGDSFLRAAYVVYDQDNRNLHLAQADNCGEHVVAIGSGPDAVPSVTGECGSPTTTTTPPSSSDSTTSPTSVPTGTGSSPTYVYPNSTVPYPTYNATSSAGPTGYPTYTSGYPTDASGYPTETSAHPTYTSTSTTSCSENEASPTTTYAPRPTYTTTYKVKQIYTVTACPPTVANCPVGHVTTEESTTTMTWYPEAPVTTVVGLESIAPWGPGGVAHHPTTTLATTASASSVGSTAFSYPTAYPTASQVVTAGAGKARAGAVAITLVAGLMVVLM